MGLFFILNSFRIKAMEKKYKQKTRISLLENKMIDEFIDHLWLEDGLSKNTLASYRSDIMNLIDWLSENKKCSLIDISQSDIQQYLSYKFPLSKARSISRSLATLRRLFRFFLSNGKINKNFQKLL